MIPLRATDGPGAVRLGGARSEGGEMGTHHLRPDAQAKWIFGRIASQPKPAHHHYWRGVIFHVLVVVAILLAGAVAVLFLAAKQDDAASQGARAGARK